MDGHFVPNISIGVPIVEAVRRITDLPLDVHLMISEPAKYIEPFRKAGADSMTIHVEAVTDPRPVLDRIRALGALAGLALNPPTPLSAIEAELAALRPGARDERDARLRRAEVRGRGARRSCASSARGRIAMRCWKWTAAWIWKRLGRVPKRAHELFVAGTAIFKHGRLCRHDRPHALEAIAMAEARLNRAGRNNQAVNSVIWFRYF